MERLTRRSFLAGSTAATASALLLGGCEKSSPDVVSEVSPSPVAPDLATWEGVRASFELDPGLHHLAAPILASHPAPVRAAIERHRKGLDENTREYLQVNETALEEASRAATATFLGTEPELVALTDSTTMGLGLLYGALDLKPGQETLTTSHDHYATHEALRLRSERTGAKVREVRLYDDPASVSASSLARNLLAKVSDKTRALAVTWVHSISGVRLPIEQIAGGLKAINRSREAKDKVLLCVDGVHGLGAVDTKIADLGCDFFVSGTHKWMWGPRGTGFVWGTEEAWATTAPTIPTFDMESYSAWLGRRSILDAPARFQKQGQRELELLDKEERPPGPLNTPGGFHSFEHRWALPEALGFLDDVGLPRIAERTAALATQLKEGLGEIPGVSVATPAGPNLSAGIVCCSLEGKDPYMVVDAFAQENGVIASVTPYSESFVRFTPSLVNDEGDMEAVLEAVAAA